MPPYSRPGLAAGKVAGVPAAVVRAALLRRAGPPSPLRGYAWGKVSAVARFFPSPAFAARLEAAANRCAPKPFPWAVRPLPARVARLLRFAQRFALLAGCAGRSLPSAARSAAARRRPAAAAGRQVHFQKRQPDRRGQPRQSMKRSSQAQDLQKQILHRPARSSRGPPVDHRSAKPGAYTRSCSPSIGRFLAPAQARFRRPHVRLLPPANSPGRSREKTTRPSGGFIHQVERRKRGNASTARSIFPLNLPKA